MADPPSGLWDPSNEAFRVAGPGGLKGPLTLNKRLRARATISPMEWPLLLACARKVCTRVPGILMVMGIKVSVGSAGWPMKYVHFFGPNSLVMSQDQVWFGAVATSSGLVYGGWSR